MCSILYIFPRSERGGRCASAVSPLFKGFLTILYIDRSIEQSTHPAPLEAVGLEVVGNLTWRFVRATTPLWNVVIDKLADVLPRQQEG